MSNTLAIATVTAALKHLIETNITLQMPNAVVKVGQPKAPAASDPAPEINISLYQVSHNVAFRNSDLPGRNSIGKLITQPRLALDLHYLVSFYGDDQELEPQRMLGRVAQILHVRPILTKQMITTTINDLSQTYPFLVNSNLAQEAIEQVKITPQAITIDELSRLWSTFFQTIPYSLSIAYLASVVLIDGDETLEPVTRVGTTNVRLVSMPPAQKAQAVLFEDVAMSHQEISGNVQIMKANNEDGITHYALYWGTNANTKLLGHGPIALLPVTGNNINYNLPANTLLPSNATHLLVFTRNDKAEMNQSISIRIKDIATAPTHQAQGVSFIDNDTDSNQIGGNVVITAASDESDLSHYALYWGSNATTKLANHEAIATIAKQGILTYHFSVDTPIPVGATHLLVFTRNGQVEMNSGISTLISE